MSINFVKKIIFALQLIFILVCLAYTLNIMMLRDNNIANDSFKVKIQEINNPQSKLIGSVFKEIYLKNLWEKHGLNNGGGSGWGSSPFFTTETRKILFNVINNYKIRSMIDAPCGSMVWIRPLLLNLTRQKNFKYLGVDIVESLITQVKHEFPLRNIDFVQADFTQSFTQNSYELVLSRDGFQHLPLIKIIDALRVFSEIPNVRYLLVSSYLNNLKNKNIRIGDYFAINLTVHPFNMTKHVAVFKENKAEREIDQKFLILFEMEYLQKFDFEAMKHEANIIK